MQGTWKARCRTFNNGYETRWAIVGPKGDVLHGNQSDPNGYSHKEAADHARLLAAAPDLLEALASLRAYVENPGSAGGWSIGDRIKILERADKALAKAREQQP